MATFQKYWIFSILTVLLATSAGAQSAEIASMHAQARVGGKTCMIEHEHYGEGDLPSRAGAERAARRAWEVHTAWEYGKAWGSYALAASPRMTCAQAGGRWLCKTIARPCRR